jgi:hypothetical protein
MAQQDILIDHARHVVVEDTLVDGQGILLQV